MGLSDIFIRRPAAPRADLVWITRDAMLKCTLKFISGNKTDICVAWFDDTRERMHRFLNEENSVKIEIKSASSLQPYHLERKRVLFFEHYPLYTRESRLLSGCNAAGITFMSSFDDIILRMFGGNISGLMRRLGLEEDQYIESPMVSRAIIRAQKKLEKKVRDDFYVRSGEEWMNSYVMMHGKGI